MKYTLLPALAALTAQAGAATALIDFGRPGATISPITSPNAYNNIGAVGTTTLIDTTATTTVWTLTLRVPPAPPPGPPLRDKPVPPRMSLPIHPHSHPPTRQPLCKITFSLTMATPCRSRPVDL